MLCDAPVPDWISGPRKYRRRWDFGVGARCLPA